MDKLKYFSSKISNMSSIKSFLEKIFLDKEYEKESKSTAHIFYCKNKVGKEVLPLIVLGAITTTFSCIGVYEYLKRREEKKETEHVNSLYSSCEDFTLLGKSDNEDKLIINKPCISIIYKWLHKKYKGK